ncbi:O-methyltransferase [Halobacillus litoralis]|uniref:O-methyltransferase n=1 Tax=Halobacillus litoralis TaxID=45668 RepID=UPI0024927292|nr:O-methyltransferase [Halobacillus litoralis]
MNSQDMWTNVDQYFLDHLFPEETIMEEVLEVNKEAGLPSIDVSPTQGKLLHLLVKMKGAKNILEIGTLGGYSSIWMAKALPEGGKLTTLEFNPKHAEIAAANMKKAGVEEKIEIIVGPALNTLPTLEMNVPFDFIFIDADKNNNPPYVNEVLKRSQSGTTLIIDNVVRSGDILESQSEDSSIQGIREMFEMLKNDPRMDSTAFQTVGSKGYDGFVLAIVK